MVRVHLHRKDISSLKKQIKKYLYENIYYGTAEEIEDEIISKKHKKIMGELIQGIFDIFIGFQFSDIREEAKND